MALRIEDRITTIALVGIGGLTLLLGIFNIHHNIKASFYGDLGASSVALSQNDKNQLDSLHVKDTDGDSVTDYDELYVYNTSPYLADSDSDGTDDQKEIAAGTDPNCSGLDCLQIRTNQPTTVTTTNNPITANVSATSPYTNTGATPTVAEIRKILLNAGVSQQVLDQTDDATLMKLYQQTVEETGGSAGTTTNQVLNPQYANLLENQSAAAAAASDPNNLTPAQIRELLVSSGVDQATLDQVSDDQLQAIYKQALGEASSQTQTNP